jgi:hypothetical protein
MLTRNALFAAATAIGVFQLFLSPITAQAEVCDVPKSGIIGPGGEAQALTGPFLVSSLVSLVDPAHPSGAYVVWTRENVWIAADNFKGTFFLAAGDKLVGRSDFTPRGVGYSGYACR